MRSTHICLGPSIQDIEFSILTLHPAFVNLLLLFALIVFKMSHDIEASKGYTSKVDGTSLNESHEQGLHTIVGLDYEDIIEGYWNSPRFLRSCTAIIFQSQ